MLIISEKLNSSIPSVLEALQNREDERLIALIQAQEKAGASYIDINTALLAEKEAETMLYAIELVKQNSTLNLMLDSPNPEVMMQAVKAAEGRKIILNSVTLTERLEELLPLLQNNPEIEVVGLPMGDDGIPATAEERVSYAEKLITKLEANGIGAHRLYLDVLVEALAVGDENAKITLETLHLMKQRFPHVKTTGGFSNISFGLPKRMILNTAFLAMAMYQGLDSAIMDPQPDSMQKSYRAINALLGNDEYCMDYIDLIRETEE